MAVFVSRNESSDRLLVLLLGVLLITSTGLQLITPQIIRRFLDIAHEQGALGSLYLAALVFLVLGLSSQLLRAFTMYLGRDVAWRATNRLRADLTMHVLQLDMGLHSAHTPGELLERIDGDIERLANFFSQFFVHLLGALLMLVGLVVISWWEDWRFGGAMAAFVAFFMLTQARIVKFATPFWQAESVARADFYGFLGEQLGGIKDTQKSGTASFTMRRMYELERRRVFTHMKAGIISGVTTGLSHSANSFRIVAGLAVGAYLFQRGDITIGTVYLIFHYLQMVGMPILTISWEFEDLQQASASIIRVKELMDRAPRVLDGGGATLPACRPACRLSIEFSEVSFSYNPDVTVLQDISFRVEPGKTLGLLGRTGSGKTTMSRLLFRFYDTDKGSVRVGDVDVRELRLGDLRSRVGLVTQEVQLFQASVRDNLTFFDPQVPDATIVETLESLGLGTWYRSLPDGLDSELTASGGQLSAGEAQLLAFARVFLRDPDYVVLDEASSRLDPATEQLIQLAVDRLLNGRTAIVIAHRLATVQKLDEIMIIEDGQVREHGERQSLATDPTSRFAGLLRTGLEEALA